MKLIDRLIGNGAAVLLSGRKQAREWATKVLEMRAVIRTIRGDTKTRKAFERNAAVVEIVIKDFRRRGEIYYDGCAGYAFFRDARQLVRLGLGEEPLEVALAMYGLAPNEYVTNQVIQMLRLEACAVGRRTTVHQLAYYDAEKNVLYVFDFDCGVYRIDTAGIKHVDNGTDGVLFVQSPNRQAFSVEGFTVCANGAWRKWIANGVHFVPGNLGTEQQEA